MLKDEQEKSGGHEAQAKYPTQTGAHKKKNKK